MDQQLVIKLTSNDGNGVPVGLVESPPMLYLNLKALHPGITFSEIATASELEPIFYGVFEWAFQPSEFLPHDQNYQDLGLTKHEDGVWRPTWKIVDATPEEIAERTNEEAIQVRNKRAKALKNSDFIFNPDAPDSIKNNLEAWKTYRQELRDLPTQAGFPWNVTFPNKPN